MAVHGGPNIVEDGLVLYLDAANPMSYPRTGTTWNDLSGNNRTTTLVNGPTFNTNNLGSVVFDGSNDYASASLPALNTVTYSFWVYLIDATDLSGECTLFGAPSDQGSISIINGTTWFSWGPGSRSGPSVTLNTWTNFVLTGDIDSTQFYINSVLTNTFNSGTTLLSGTGYFCSYLDQSRLLNTRVANISFYNRRLTAREILQNYNATRSRFGV